MRCRFGIPEEIAQAALFLASGELSFLHIACSWDTSYANYRP